MEDGGIGKRRAQSGDENKRRFLRFNRAVLPGPRPGALQTCGRQIVNVRVNVNAYGGKRKAGGLGGEIGDGGAGADEVAVAVDGVDA